MNKSISITLALAIVVTGTVLFSFQNCSEPSDYGPTNPSTTGTTGDPGSANSTSDLGNTGVSNLPPPVTVAAGSLPSSQYVTNLYQGILQRPATSQELASWAQYISLGYGCTFIAQQVLGSAEYVALAPTLPPGTFVYDIYKGLLNRSPTSTEQAQGIAMVAQYGSNTSTAPVLASSVTSTAGFKTYCAEYQNMTL